MRDLPKCPQCGSEYTYEDGQLFCLSTVRSRVLAN